MTPNTNLLHPDGVGSRLVELGELGELGELAERCERASGPDRELDAAIARAIGFGCVAQDPQASGDGWIAWTGPHFRSGPWERLKAYTASVDAAMALVPKGLMFELTTTGFKPGATVCGSSISDTHEGSYAATPALALTAACLRALAHRKERGGE